jgi:hypothetical protein
MKSLRLNNDRLGRSKIYLVPSAAKSPVPFVVQNCPACVINCIACIILSTFFGTILSLEPTFLCAEVIFAIDDASKTCLLLSSQLCLTVWYQCIFLMDTTLHMMLER